VKQLAEINLPKYRRITVNIALVIFVLLFVSNIACFNASKKTSYQKHKYTGYPPDYPFEYGVPLEHKPRVVVTDDLYEAESLNGGIIDKNPVLIRYKAPDYPKLPLEAGIQGLVVLDLLLDENGNVPEASVYKSDVSLVMEKAALESIKSFKFKPAERSGKKIGCKIKVPIYFWLY
jgi:TonB family protein